MVLEKLEKLERDLTNERIYLIKQLALLNKQLNNLQVEYMQIAQTMDLPVENSSCVAEIKSVNSEKNEKTENLDNVTEINSKPLSLSSNEVLTSMMRGQFHVDEEMEEDDE